LSGAGVRLRFKFLAVSNAAKPDLRGESGGYDGYGGLHSEQATSVNLQKFATA
jgi:hypothetical protein